VGGSRSEAPTESKDPLPACGEVGSKRSSHDTRQRGEDSLIGLCWDLQVWGPSTAFPFASRTETPLRMTDFYRVCMKDHDISFISFAAAPALYTLA
jgi:hypothetical protein